MPWTPGPARQDRTAHSQRGLNAIARSRVLAAMSKPALVGRRHDDASLHPQGSVSNINVREGARFREGHSEAVVATAIGRVEHARVQEARAVIAGRVPTWTTFVPIGDRRLTFYHKSDRQQVVESKRKLRVSRKSDTTRRKTSDDATIDTVVATAVGG